ncbi:MAG: histidine kinase, partial [Saprospiraceae bacterium]|nr:histidine kinase [Saprospiraceae bacterium]
LAYSRFQDLTRARQDLIQLKEEKKRAEEALSELKDAQKQLIHAEKMASLGELTAGIAHEIQNPLNFVNNFSEVSHEMIEEVKEELKDGDPEEVEAILNDLTTNLEKIAHHGQRASGIVRSMLDHSRASGGEKVETDINALCDEYLRLAYHGMRAKDRNFNAELETSFDESLPKVKVIPQDIGRVLLNLINNAFQAVSEARDLTGFPDNKHKTSSEDPNSLNQSLTSNLAGQNPKVKVTTKNIEDQIQITVSDNGPGIPDDIKDKIFQPFFTTKPTGEGTGLGLSLSYDIVKAHGGELIAESEHEKGTTFIILLPLKNHSE